MTTVYACNVRIDNLIVYEAFFVEPRLIFTGKQSLDAFLFDIGDSTDIWLPFHNGQLIVSHPNSEYLGEFGRTRTGVVNVIPPRDMNYISEQIRRFANPELQVRRVRELLRN